VGGHSSIERRNPLCHPLRRSLAIKSLASRHVSITTGFGGGATFHGSS
jgi:hypothetical protein